MATAPLLTTISLSFGEVYGEDFTSRRIALSPVNHAAVLEGMLEDGFGND
jgi:hypothetical protein